MISNEGKPSDSRTAVGHLRKHKRHKCVIKSNTRLPKSKKCVCPRCGTAYALTKIPNKEE